MGSDSQNFAQVADEILVQQAEPAQLRFGEKRGIAKIIGLDLERGPRRRTREDVDRVLGRGLDILCEQPIDLVLIEKIADGV